MAGQTVTLLERTAASGGFGVAQTTTTDAHGFYELTVAARAEQQHLLRPLPRRRERTQDGHASPHR